MLIAVDFDGTIVPDKFYPDRPITEELPLAIRTLNDLADLGHVIVIWTLRDSSRMLPNRSFQLMVEFLRSRGFTRYHTCCNYKIVHKLPADLFIEDKVVGGFPGWDKVREHFKLPKI